MSIFGTIRITMTDGTAPTIVGYRVRRTSPTYVLEDTICTYTWEVQRNYHNRILKSEGTIEHRYGDGAESLLAQVLLLAGPQLMEQQRALVSAEPK